MASLLNIEQMRVELENNDLPSEPKWIRGLQPRSMHLSGELREAAMNWSNLPPEIEELLDEAAETLDDAHEEWLMERLMKFRSVKYE